MNRISVCMIVKNEEDILKRCLDSLKGIWDELIIVDTGSTDATKAVAAEYTDKIYDFKWTGNFSDARNFAFSKAGMEYIYSADADEVLDDGVLILLQVPLLLRDIRHRTHLVAGHGRVRRVLGRDQTGEQLDEQHQRIHDEDQAANAHGGESHQGLPARGAEGFGDDLREDEDQDGHQGAHEAQPL